MSSPPPKRQRRRPAKSCEQCRRRKIRCDQDHPCGACVRARASLECSYRDDASGKVPVSATRVQNTVLSESSSTAEVHVGSQRGVNLQDEEGDLYPRTSVQRPVIPADSERAPAPEGERAFSINPQSQPSFLLSSSTSIPPVIPRLRNVPEKTKLFGQTHWLHTAEKFPVSGKFHPVEIEPSFYDAKAELLEALKETRTLRHAIKAQNSVKLEGPIKDLLGTLPQKSTCDALVQCYFRTFEPLYRIIYLPTFWGEYDLIWDAQLVVSAPVMFLTKLTLILAMGTTFYMANDEHEMTHLCRLAQTWIQNAQWWLTGPSEKSTHNLDGLQVMCLLILARQTTFNCSGATSWLSTGSLLRMAITTGLHRNPQLFPTLSLCQREIRARLWNTVLEFSTQSCLDLALPLNLSADDYDAAIPSNYNDIDLDSNTPKTPAPSSVCTDSSLQILLAKSLPLRMKVVRILNDFRNEQSYDAALEISTELRTACREAAAFFHFHGTASEETSERSKLKATDFHRKFIDIHLRRFTLFLHRDFMLRARVDPRFYLSRKLCVESSMVIASAGKDSDLSLPIADLDDLSKLALVGRGLYKGAFSLDATLVLALEIITQLDEEAALQGEADALDEMAKAARAPLIKTLEHIYGQLSHLLAHGNTSLKRLLFVAAYLSQIRAMEAGRPIKPAVYESITKELRKCVAALRENLAGGTPQELAGVEDGLEAELFPLDFLSGVSTTGWDIANLLYFPTPNELGETQWPT